ncbi:MAG: ErfK/YbiS/YcfS/YnhG family protein [Chloroflexi bacterium OLB14]|nr:MAG: ErfK/YbiS/YcfS/YnhG family protein [Chloroflexi bacterium OLB14]
MKKNISRRDFLKISGIGLSALAFKPYLLPQYEYFASPKRLPQFPASEIIGRVTDPDVDLRSRPTNDPGLNTSIGKLAADTLVEWNREVIGNVVGGLANQKYVETPQGYIYGSILQPTRNLPNTPVTELPNGQGFFAEVTVPYVDLAHEGVVASPWLQDHIVFNFPPRLYYGQVVWIDQIRNVNGFVEYRWNEDAAGRGYGYGGSYGEYFWGDGAAFKILTEDDVSMISPDIDPAEKTISIDLDYQTLSCYEGTREVFFCQISSGKSYDPVTGEIVDTFATPAGTLLTYWKIVSKNMTAGNEGASGYSTPAVPWCTFIASGGVAIHGAFWHNAFGEKTFTWLCECFTRTRQMDFSLDNSLCIFSRR